MSSLRPRQLSRASLMVVFDKCESSLAGLQNARGFESNTLYFDPWHGKHSVSHVPSRSISGENYLFLFDFYYLILFLCYFYLIFIIFRQGSDPGGAG